MCQVWRYRYKWLSLGTASADGVFRRKTDEIFKELPNVFGIADDILIVGYDDNGRDHDNLLRRLLEICREGSLNLNKDKCHFRWPSVPFLARLYPDMAWNTASNGLETVQNNRSHTRNATKGLSNAQKWPRNEKGKKVKCQKMAKNIFSTLDIITERIRNVWKQPRSENEWCSTIWSNANIANIIIVNIVCTVPRIGRKGKVTVVSVKGNQSNITCVDFSSITNITWCIVIDM